MKKTDKDKLFEAFEKVCKVKLIKEENHENKKNFSLVIDKQSNRYFLTKKDNNKYIIINEKTKEISEIEHNLAKQLFRIVGDATDIENSQINKLIK
jgi:hypothetical protein